jgi:hypothetical protein
LIIPCIGHTRIATEGNVDVFKVAADKLSLPGKVNQ